LLPGNNHEGFQFSFATGTEVARFCEQWQYCIRNYVQNKLTLAFYFDLPSQMAPLSSPSATVFYALFLSVQLTLLLRAQGADSKSSRPAWDDLENALGGSQTEEDIRVKNWEADRSLVKQPPLTRGLKYDEERGAFLDHSDGMRGHGYHLTTEGDWTQLFDSTTSSDWRTYKEEKSGDVVSFNPKISEVDRNRNSGKYEAYLIEPAQEGGAWKNGTSTNPAKKVPLKSYKAVNPKTGQMETYLGEPPNNSFPGDFQDDPRQKRAPLKTYSGVNPKTGEREMYVEEPANESFPRDPQDDPRQRNVPMKSGSGSGGGYGGGAHDTRWGDLTWGQILERSEAGGAHDTRGWMDDGDRSNNGLFRKESQIPIGGAPLRTPSTTLNSPKPAQPRVQPDGSTLDDVLRKNENNFLRYGQTAQSWSEFCKKERERAALGTSEIDPKILKNQKSEGNLFVSPEGKIATLPRLDSPDKSAPSNPSAVSTPAEPNANRRTLPHLNIFQQIIASGLMPLPKPNTNGTTSVDSANGSRGQKTSPLAASASDWGKLNRGEITAKPAPASPNSNGASKSDSAVVQQRVPSGGTSSNVSASDWGKLNRGEITAKPTPSTANTNGVSKSDSAAVQQRVPSGGTPNNVPFDPWSKSNKSSSLTKTGPAESSGTSSGTKVPGNSLSTASDSGGKGSSTTAPVAKTAQSSGLGALPFKSPPSSVAAANTGGGIGNVSGGGRAAQAASSSGLGQLPFKSAPSPVAAANIGGSIGNVSGGGRAAQPASSSGLGALPFKSPPSPVAAANSGGSSKPRSSQTHYYDNSHSDEDSSSDGSFSSSFRMPVIPQYVPTPLVVPHIPTPAPSHYNPPVSHSNYSFGSGHH
jgi:hypothetical protein